MNTYILAVFHQLEFALFFLVPFSVVGYWVYISAGTVYLLLRSYYFFAVF
jgi:hypothetical protein